MYHPNQQTFFKLFSVVPNPKLRGYFAIKYPTGKIVPVHGTIRQVERTILRISAKELQEELNSLLSQYAKSDINKVQNERNILSLIGLISSIS